MISVATNTLNMLKKIEKCQRVINYATSSPKTPTTNSSKHIGMDGYPTLIFFFLLIILTIEECMTKT